MILWSYLFIIRSIIVLTCRLRSVAVIWMQFNILSQFLLLKPFYSMMLTPPWCFTVRIKLVRSWRVVSNRCSLREWAQCQFCQTLESFSMIEWWKRHKNPKTTKWKRSLIPAFEILLTPNKFCDSQILGHIPYSFLSTVCLDRVLNALVCALGPWEPQKTVNFGTILSWIRSTISNTINGNGANFITSVLDTLLL